MRNRIIKNLNTPGVITFIITMVILSNTVNGFPRNAGVEKKNMYDTIFISSGIEPNGSEFRPDEISSHICLGCHDGVIASDPYMFPETDEINNAPSIGLSHPVVINYSDSVNRSPGRYIASQSLDSRIRLFNGKIECLSCHDPDSDNRHHLVINNRRSKLCFSCHNL